MSKIVERGLWVFPRSLSDAVKFRVQFLTGKAELPHCFPRFRLGLLEPFPMYAVFPRSEYYGSSDFSEPSQFLALLSLASGTFSRLDVALRGVHRDLFC